jgi:hypothetical protein
MCDPNWEILSAIQRCRKSALDHKSPFSASGGVERATKGKMEVRERRRARNAMKFFLNLRGA